MSLGAGVRLDFPYFLSPSLYHCRLLKEACYRFLYQFTHRCCHCGHYSSLAKSAAPEEAGKPLMFQLHQIDPIGTLVFVPGIVCLLLALQWGGSTYQWKDGRIIALLVLAGVLLLAFIAVQLWEGDSATVPARNIKQRSIAAGFYRAFCSGSAMMVIIYFLATWFQAI